jgi:hypothetical protein
VPKKYLNGVRIPPDSHISKKYKLKYQDNDSPHSFNVTDYEGGVIGAQQRVCGQGNKVVIIGGGYGITTVKAAELVGDSGKVTVYEGGNREKKTLEETLDVNEIKPICESHQVVVGEELGVYSDSSHSDSKRPENIPECDVLELDCEGSELGILKNMKITPKSVIVELHPWEYPDVMMEPINILENKGYEVCYRSGHDGIQINEIELETLMKKSCERSGEHNIERTGEKYLESGARWPVVIAATL